MVFKFGDFKVDVNTEKTQEFYHTMNTVSENCPCEGCRNFEAAVDFVPEEVKNFFDVLGVDMKKASEIGVPYEGLLYKNLWWYEYRYYICGRLLNSKNKHFKPYKICRGFEAFFDIENMYFLPENFPEPVLQMHIDANLPWVI